MLRSGCSGMVMTPADFARCTDFSVLLPRELRPHFIRVPRGALGGIG